MRGAGLGLVVLFVVASAPLAAESPPAETLARLQAAEETLQAWPGTYVVTTRGAFSKVDGDDREEIVRVARMAPGPDGSEEAEVLSASRNGKDATAEAREGLAKRREKRAKQRSRSGGGAANGDDEGLSLTLPGGEQTAKFEFTALPGGGDACAARFAPRREHARDAGLTVGELHWDCATLDPLWVSARPAKNPTGISEMTLRLEIRRAGDLLFVARTVTDGIGGVLFIKRRFHVEAEVSELAPRGDAGAAVSP